MIILTDGEIKSMSSYAFKVRHVWGYIILITLSLFSLFVFSFFFSNFKSKATIQLKISLVHIYLSKFRDLKGKDNER